MNSVVDQTVVRLKDFRIADVGDRVSSAVNSVADRVLGAAKDTTGYVRSNPWQAAGAIALAGVAAGVAGVLVSRRARARKAHTSRDTNRDSTSEVSGG